MILLFSGIILFISVVGFFVSLNNSWEGATLLWFFLGFLIIVFGFLLMGTMLSVETEIIIPQSAFIEKNENSIIVVVPNIGNKVITDPAVIRYLEVGDTIKVSKDYNSYGGQINSTRIYVEKNGWKY